MTYTIFSSDVNFRWPVLINIIYEAFSKKQADTFLAKKKKNKL